MFFLPSYPHQGAQEEVDEEDAVHLSLLVDFQKHLRITRIISPHAERDALVTHVLQGTIYRVGAYLSSLGPGYLRDHGSNLLLKPCCLSPGLQRCGGVAA